MRIPLAVLPSCVFCYSNLEYLPLLWTGHREPVQFPRLALPSGSGQLPRAESNQGQPRAGQHEPRASNAGNYARASIRACERLLTSIYGPAGTSSPPRGAILATCGPAGTSSPPSGSPVQFGPAPENQFPSRPVSPSGCPGQRASSCSSPRNQRASSCSSRAVQFPRLALPSGSPVWLHGKALGGQLSGASSPPRW
jgi:hypothetical protein